MSLLDLLKAPPTLAPAWRGTWARIWLRPSVFSPQSFIVGVAVMDAEGLCDFRFITDSSKFECVYGMPGRTLVDQLIAEARQTLAHAREKHTPISTGSMPSAMRIDPVGYIAAASAAHALEEALNEAEIPMEPKPEIAKAPRFKSRNAEDVTQAVIDAVRQRMSLRAETVLREDSFGDMHHQASVNLVRSNAAGLIVSGWYADPLRVQLSILQAAATVETYTAIYRKPHPGGVFLLRPTELSGLRKEQSLAIEEALDKVDWQLNQKGLRVAVREFESELAEDVEDWAQDTA